MEGGTVTKNAARWDRKARRWVAVVQERDAATGRLLREREVGHEATQVRALILCRRYRAAA